MLMILVLVVVHPPTDFVSHQRLSLTVLLPHKTTAARMGGGEHYYPNSPGARHQSSPRPRPIPLQISDAHSLNLGTTGCEPPASSASSNCWGSQYESLQGEHQCADTLSDAGSSRGKRKLDEDDRHEILKQENVRRFDQMIDDPLEHCYKVIADSAHDARKEVIYCQTNAAKYHLEHIQESEQSVVDIADERNWLKENLAKQIQELEHNFCAQQRNLQRSHDKAMAQNDQHQQKTALTLAELKRKHSIFCNKIQPVIVAMSNPTSDLPNCFYDLGSASRQLVYYVRLGDTTRTSSLHDIQIRIGLCDNVSCLKLSSQHPVAAASFLPSAG